VRLIVARKLVECTIEPVQDGGVFVELGVYSYVGTQSPNVRFLG
jgi:hypothetical protein